MKIKMNRFLGITACMLLVVLTACEDGKKKEQEAKMEAEKVEMEAAEQERMMMEENAKKEQMMKEEAMTNSIAGKAMTNENLTTLVTALQTADLATMLSEPGEYTVFAPSNQAFSKLPKGTVESLLKPENKEKLQGVLQYHVVSGKMTSDKFAESIKGANGKYKFKTVKGEELTAMMSGDQFVIMDESGKKAQVIQGNVDASNGIVYVIDTVLMTKK
ncbi:fasciclin domain-containing protein [Psychroserpens sp. Hel_I_66]|uniref:fasciclin domain-containing protein n=1 Tax=Psychroserpens sp. Hel_I_66 TaxID=1250004 RepID=UPI0009DE3B49|nr:fasciclin domain-containing protein [Psychroserpens sp. Hel_I_66]